MKSCFYQRPYQLEKLAECVTLLPDISLLHFLLNLPGEDIYIDDFKTIKGLKDATVCELGHCYSQIVDKSVTDQGPVRLPAVTLRKRPQTGSCTQNAAGGHPRV